MGGQQQVAGKCGFLQKVRGPPINKKVRLPKESGSEVSGQRRLFKLKQGVTRHISTTEMYRFVSQPGVSFLWRQKCQKKKA